MAEFTCAGACWRLKGVLFTALSRAVGSLLAPADGAWRLQ